MTRYYVEFYIMGDNSGQVVSFATETDQQRFEAMLNDGDPTSPYYRNPARKPTVSIVG